jgi:hypothetical protein
MSALLVRCSAGRKDQRNPPIILVSVLSCQHYAGDPGQLGLAEAERRRSAGPATAPDTLFVADVPPMGIAGADCYDSHRCGIGGDASSTFLAVLFACWCAQLAVASLVLVPIAVGDREKGTVTLPGLCRRTVGARCGLADTRRAKSPPLFRFTAPHLLLAKLCAPPVRDSFLPARSHA